MSDDVTVHHGDALNVLPGLPDASFDACVTDPPYEFSFMGKSWDGTGVAFKPETWAQVLRLLKPGGHLLAFGGTRTFHRLVCAIEDAGFEIRDTISWLYGSGFPKSLDVSKAIDRARNDRDAVLALTSALADLAESAGITRADIDTHMGTSDMGGWWLSRLPHRAACPSVENWARLRDFIPGARALDDEVWRLNGRKGKPGEAWSQREVIGDARNWGGPSLHTPNAPNGKWDVTAPASDDARRWQGWGTSLKPAWEPIIVARKPLAGTVATNVLAHGTGALNIAATRISPSSPEHDGRVSVPLSALDSQPDNGHDGPESARGSSRRTSPEQPAYSSACTCPGRESGGLLHTTHTQRAGVSEPSPERRNDLLANVPGDESDYPRSPDSPADYRPSPRSDGGRAPSAAMGDQASALPLDDAPEPLAPRAELPHSRSGQSMPCPNCTTGDVQRPAESAGRWPANVVLDEDAAAQLDRQSGWRDAGRFPGRQNVEPGSRGTTMGVGWSGSVAPERDLDSGGASRFYYTAKAAPDERPRVNGVSHPTVKPLDLIRWLVRLVTPPGGLVLDPFTGSGTTGEACLVEGFRCVLIEREADYLPLIRARLSKPIQPVLGVAP